MSLYYIITLTKSEIFPDSKFFLYLLTYLIMDISFLKSCFLNLAQNEINTLSKLEPSEIASMTLGFIFLIASCFLQE